MNDNSHFERDYQARKMLAEEYPIAKEKILTFLMQLEGRKTIGSAIVNRFKTEYKKTIEEGETLETLAMMSPMEYYAIAEFKDAMDKALKLGGPVWIECVIDREEAVLPMIPAGGSVDDIIIN
jgi:hypothetical protein